MARAKDADLCEQIKECFRQFDKDGNGAISRSELQEVLLRVCKPGACLTKEDIDLCVQQADKNDNGVIEYNEFVDWVMTPGARIQASTHGAELFDLEKVLKPLFEAFDRNGNGILSMPEFEESFCILQNSVKMSVKGAFKSSPAPSQLAREASVVFKDIDGEGNSDRMITFDEFVKWQRKALKDSGLLNQDLVDLVPALARQLQRIFMFTEAEARGVGGEEDMKILEHIIDNLATFSRDIWNEEHAGHSSLHGRHHYRNRWAEPPPGLNVERLMRQHMGTYGVRLQDLDTFDLQVFCLPELEVDEVQADQGSPTGQQERSTTPDTHKKSAAPAPTRRRWIARISQGFDREESGKALYHAHTYSVYSSLSWEEDDEAEELFQKALEAFSPDMRFFCLLKTTANYGIDIPFSRVQATMRTAVDFGLIAKEHLERYYNHMEVKVMDSLRQDGTYKGTSRAERERKAREVMDKTLKLTTRNVMATLVALGVFEVSSKLADILSA